MHSIKKDRQNCPMMMIWIYTKRESSSKLYTLEEKVLCPRSVWILKAHVLPILTISYLIRLLSDQWLNKWSTQTSESLHPNLNETKCWIVPDWPAFPPVSPPYPLTRTKRPIPSYLDTFSLASPFPIHASDLKKRYIVGQFRNTFIIIRHSHSLYVIDQHAADERIKLEAPGIPNAYLLRCLRTIPELSTPPTASNAWLITANSTSPSRITTIPDPSQATPRERCSHAKRLA